ncbi:MAG: LTA synthase family protein [Methylococcaceae bacterium]|nr:LTA synthase family protein [Methylococcaceae bacterium]MDZ4155484.1 LTA synthase family protein [Methylococcales bacterium]MDP2392169.1 LTA synthase family protein [Methylococcaceae bacterium]MDP3019441.1 LTA synthase family protein [Methylococcaceae bacterium]MDP3388626.1 LTA synthase family protein [Methylococcaceae bacterium]
MPKKSLPLISTTLFYALYYLISTLEFDVQILPQSVPYDYLLQLGIAYLVFALSKKPSVFLIIHGLMMGVLYIGNAVKISFFGGPIMPDDVYALRSLLLILEGWRFFAVAIPLAAIASLLLFNFRIRHWSGYLASMILMLLGITMLYKPAAFVVPLDNYFGNSVWDQRSNYVWRGATLYSLLETGRYFAAADVPPDADSVQEATESLLATVPPLEKVGTSKEFTPRNVHIVLLESFWDPNELKKAKFNQNPLSPEFRQLWKTAGNSHALTPVFGGFTANSEFEVLCGFPVSKDNVKFERQLLNDVPCLPHLLADKGYRTLVSHPNVPVFWNRVNSYKRIGFQTYWSIQDFELDDMNEEFLADSSLYRQVTAKISGSLEAKQPVLDYIVTYFGHWTYPLNESRPNQISTRSEVEEVKAYANTVYYKSRELMDFINDMRKRDPDGIIVVFGDHLPFLGENFGGYVDSNVLTTNKTDFTPAMFKFYVSTPMIIIDGKRGPLKIGSLPLYQVPKLVLDLLNYDEPSIMDYTAAIPGLQVRPLPGLHFNVSTNGSVDTCKEPPYSDGCQLSARWLENVNIISNDLFIGRQFARPKHPMDPVSPAITAQLAPTIN